MARKRNVIVCPFCDEVSVWEGEPLQTGRMIIWPRKCMMGHTFYSKEIVPDKYGEFHEMVEQLIERETEREEVARIEKHKKYHREYSRKRRKKEKEARKLKEQEERAYRKAHPELYDPDPRIMGKHYFVVKKAGEKKYHRLENPSHKKKQSIAAKANYRKKEAERKKRRDEYLKGGFMSVYKDK